MEDQQYSSSTHFHNVTGQSPILEDYRDRDTLRFNSQSYKGPNGFGQSDWKEAERPHQPSPGRYKFKSSRRRKARRLFYIFCCSFIIALSAFIAISAGIDTSLHSRSPSDDAKDQEAVRPGFLIWSNATDANNVTQVSREVDSSSQYLTVKKVTILGAQHSTSVTNISRDGGSSVLLNGNVVWLYDDTASRNRSGGIISFLSNTAAYSSDPNGSVTSVRDFGALLVNQSDPFKLETGILAHDVVKNGGWIPFNETETETNRKDPMQERVAICMCCMGAFAVHFAQSRLLHPAYTNILNICPRLAPYELNHIHQFLHFQCLSACWHLFKTTCCIASPY